MRKMKRIERAIVAGDLHIPFIEIKAVELFFNFTEKFKPHKIFLNGDIVDCWDVSTFAKPLSIEERMEDEIKQGRDFLHRLRKQNPDADIVYIFGNHEFRFERYISKFARELKGLRGLTLEEQLDLPELNIRVVNSHQRENYYRYGHLLVAHFNRALKHSAYTAKNLLDEKGMSLIQNHTHRGGCSFKRDYMDTKVAVENFCLCDLNPPYMSIPNWQLGFSTIHTDTKTGFFKITEIPIIDYQILYGDKLFKL